MNSATIVQKLWNYWDGAYLLSWTFVVLSRRLVLLRSFLSGSRVQWAAAARPIDC